MTSNPAATVLPPLLPYPSLSGVLNLDDIGLSPGGSSKLPPTAVGIAVKALKYEISVE